VKFNTKEGTRFLNAPDPSIRLVLFYGSDQGLIHERAQKFLKSRVEDPDDPFLVGHLTGAQIKKDPGELLNEAAAMSLVGGDRTIVIKLGSEDISKTLEQCLNNKQCSIIIIEAGELGPKSPVRKMIEKKRNAAAIPGYLDNPTELNELIDSRLKSSEKLIDAKSKNYLVNNIGSDRMVSRSELNKLITYMGKTKEVNIDDVLAIIGDNGAFSLDKITYSVASGNHRKMEVNLERAFKEGQTSIAVLRATTRHFHKIHLALGYIERGSTPREALKAIKPPIIYLFVDEFLQQLERWSSDKVGKALTVLNDAEIKCKTTGFPVTAICGRALMSLSQAVKTS
jgi:DNA polymerase-3 subunit delta